MKGFWELEGIINPKWIDIKTALLKLDGEIETEINLSYYLSKEDHDDGYCNSYIAVCGGNNGMYLVFISYNTHEDNENFYELMDLKKTKGNMVELVIGGQKSNYDECKCVSMNEMFVAVKTFFNEKKPDSSLSWEYNGGIKDKSFFGENIKVFKEN
jgi:hypothetical protein